MIDYSPCKINIGLNIISKRSDGYHNLESIFYPIPLFDIIEITKSDNGNFNYSQSGLVIDSPLENNLLYKAWNLINKEFNIGGIDLHIFKQIPMQAGLGGGSANASTLLKMIRKEFALDVSDKRLQKMAAIIGSDCPFFIENKAVYAYNKGNYFENIDLDLSNYYIKIIKAPVAVSTQEAYAGINPKANPINLKSLSCSTINEWKDNVKNDFENHVFETLPKLKEIKEKLYSEGAVYAAMSGSGSAVYGIFEEENKINGFPEDYFVWSGQLG